MAKQHQKTCSHCGKSLLEAGISPTNLNLCLICQTKIDERAALATADMPATPVAASDSFEISVPPLNSVDRETFIVAVEGTPEAKIQNPTVFAPALGNAHQIGRFKIRAILGTGAFGTVYRAHDPLLDREVALKVPRIPVDDAQQKEKFVHEAKAAARLRHPNIVTVFECGEFEGQPFIVSEYVDGVSLSQILEKEEPKLEVAVRWVQQIAEAIDYAHSEGVVHRDLKPSNIMLSKNGRPQVMDFGLAKRIAHSEDSMTIDGTIVGTPVYMSPEQARGEKSRVGPKSDQYSVGAILYEMLCGKTPYRGELWSVISNVANPNILPPSPRKLKPGIPLDLEACCLKAMEKNPDSRYSSLQTFADDLSAWLEGRPLKVRPIKSTEKLVRWGRRNRLAASLILAITSLIVTVSIIAPFVAFYYFQLAGQLTIKERAAVVAQKSAVDAQREAEKAQREVELMLIDAWTQTGFDVAKEGRNDESLLWISNAYRRLKDDPKRAFVLENNIHTRINSTPIPIRMYPSSAFNVRNIEYHPSSRYLLLEESTSHDVNQVSIWDNLTAKKWPAPVSESIASANWSGDGKKLALGVANSLRICSFPEGNLLSSYLLPEPVSIVRFSDDNNLVAVVSRLGENNGNSASVSIFDLRKPDKPVSTIDFEQECEAIVWHPNHKYIACYTEDYHWHIFQLQETEAKPVLVRDIFVGNNHLVIPLVFHGDKQCVVASKDSSIRGVHCLDLVSGEVAWKIEYSETMNIDVLNISLSHDRQTLAATTNRGVQLIDLSNGQERSSSLQHPNNVVCASFSSDDKLLLTASADSNVRLFDLESGKLLSVLKHNDDIRWVMWSPDDKTCATVSYRSTHARVWRMPKDIQPKYDVVQPSEMHLVKWSEDGSSAVATSFDRFFGADNLTIIDASTGVRRGAPLQFGSTICDSCFVAKPSQMLVCGFPLNTIVTASSYDLSIGGRAAIFDFISGNKIVDVFKEPGKPFHFPSTPIATETSPKRDRAVILCYGGEFFVVETASGKILSSGIAFDGSQAVIGYMIHRRIAFTPKGDTFVVWGCNGRLVEGYRVADGQQAFVRLLHRPTEGYGLIHDVSFSPDGTKMATCSADGTCHVWSMENLGGEPRILQHTDWVFSAKFNREGTEILTSCRDKHARIWSLTGTNNVPRVIIPAQSDEIYDACYLPGEKAFVTLSRDGELNSWDTEFGAPTAPSRRFHSARGYVCAISPDQSKLLLLDGDGKHLTCFDLHHWQPKSEEQLKMDEIVSLSELLSTQNLKDGVPIRLSDAECQSRWESLYSKHRDHAIFTW